MESLESRSTFILNLVKSKISLLGLLLVIFFFSFLYWMNGTETESNFYLIGQEVHWKGANLYTKEKNLSAFNHELLTRIGLESDSRFKVVNFNSNEMETRLRNGEFQGVLTANQPNPLSNYSFVFSDIFFFTGPVLTIAAEDSFPGWDGMAKKIIGVQSYTPTVLSIQKNYNIQIKSYTDINRAFADLDDNKIDGVIYFAIPSYLFVRTFYKDKLKVVTPPLNQEGLRLMGLKTPQGEQMVKKFNEGLKEVMETGTFTDLIDKWGLIDATNINE